MTREVEQARDWVNLELPSGVAFAVATTGVIRQHWGVTESSGTDQLKEQLRAVGLRATASRIAVLRMLQAAPRPLSHADVVEGLDHQPWDRATIYRNLVDLVGAGLARKVELGDRVWRFDGSAHSQTHDAALHPHFVCTSCGSVECLTDVTINTPRRGIPRALAERDVEVHVRGVCDSCQ